MKTMLDEDGEWANPRQEDIYSSKHHYWRYSSFTLDHTERVAREEGYGLSVVASITSGCQVVLATKHFKLIIII